ncbi:uncharacterized protein LOC133782582 [Humulus lupulus]|uniref:uncharacterized protein LOC133782582 n=1 Tax=Humulus lupulus TaxID=3486 RepID=UPI002B40CBC6|nr:uncharacterized protein LOC133782582 [Humulus lupulus]
MSTSLRFGVMATDEISPSHHELRNNKGALSSVNGSLEAKREVGGGAKSSSGRGRKPTNKGPSNTKKQPQRGLGVAQLERLRLQEWKKINEMPQQVLHPGTPTAAGALNFPVPAPVVDHNSFQFQMVPNSVITAMTEPLHSVPVQYGAGGSYGAGTTRFLSAVVHQPGHVAAASGFMSCSGDCGSSPAGILEHRSVVVDPHHPHPHPHHHLHHPYHHCYGILNSNGSLGSSPDQMFPVGAAVYDHHPHHENSKELSSIPKMQSFINPSQLQDRSDFCFKKTRFNGENIGELTLGLGTRGVRSTSHDDEGLEIVAVHRKVNSVSGGVVMEYEFFPGKNDSCGISGTGSNEILMKKMPTSSDHPTSISVADEASYINTFSASAAATTTTYGSDISNPVDLSLKL